MKDFKFKIGQKVYYTQTANNALYHISCDEISQIIIDEKGVWYQLTRSSGLFMDTQLFDNVKDADEKAIAETTVSKMTDKKKEISDIWDDDDEDENKVIKGYPIESPTIKKIKWKTPV